MYPTFDNHRIYQLQHAETESVPNVVRLLSAETECPPKVPICPHSAPKPKPKPKPKFGRPLDEMEMYQTTCGNQMSFVDRVYTSAYHPQLSFRQFQMLTAS